MSYLQFVTGQHIQRSEICRRKGGGGGNGREVWQIVGDKL